jgi:phage shock protein PspC (stress-responsive transcriptional regulator)
MNELFSGHNYGTMAATYLGISPALVGVLLAAVAVWTLAWKGVALWFAARNHQKKWFIVLLILNTVGILDIVYLLWFRRDKQEGVTTSLFNNPLPGEEVEENTETAA